MQITQTYLDEKKMFNKVKDKVTLEDLNKLVAIRESFYKLEVGQFYWMLEKIRKNLTFFDDETQKRYFEICPADGRKFDLRIVDLEWLLSKVLMGIYYENQVREGSDSVHQH